MLKLRTLYYRLTPVWRYRVRAWWFAPIDFLEGILKRRPAMVPPRGKIYTGSGDFVRQGERHLDYLCRYVALHPVHHVLDIGSGMGRTARALTTYLNQAGRYDGFDVVEQGVNWCREQISTRYPNFTFQYLPLHNDLYNQNGELAVNLRFPYEHESFDRICLFSVFTHMSVEEIRHYLMEMHRVLKTDGKCLLTFFWYDAETLERLNNDQTDMQFPVVKDAYRLSDEKVLSANLCISLDYLENMLMETNWLIVLKVQGYWRNFANQQEGQDYQDILVIEKSKPVN